MADHDKDGENVGRASMQTMCKTFADCIQKWIYEKYPSLIYLKSDKVIVSLMIDIITENKYRGKCGQDVHGGNTTNALAVASALRKGHDD